MAVTKGKQRCLSVVENPRHSGGVGFSSVDWEETGRPRPVSDMSNIMVRGTVHRVPTVLRPGPANMSWKYDPASFDLESPDSTVSHTMRQ